MSHDNENKNKICADSEHCFSGDMDKDHPCRKHWKTGCCKCGFPQETSDSEPELSTPPSEVSTCEHLGGYCKDGYNICGDCGEKVGGNGIAPEKSILNNEVSTETIKQKIEKILRNPPTWTDGNPKTQSERIMDIVLSVREEAKREERGKVCVEISEIISKMIIQSKDLFFIHHLETLQMQVLNQGINLSDNKN